MLVEVKRFKQGKYSTLSKVFVDGVFFCYGLEDEVRMEKIPGSTAIPAGTYRLGWNIFGAMNARYKRRYPTLHRGMLEIKDIPNFKYVYIHIGNNIGDTSGCLLVGNRYDKDDDGDYFLEQSAKAYKKLYRVLHEAVANGIAEIMIKNEYYEKDHK